MSGLYSAAADFSTDCAVDASHGYAPLATATGATVYVGLRQLAERGFVTLISVRICLAAAATLVVVPEALVEHCYEQLRRHVDARCLERR